MFFCDVESDLLHIVYMNFVLQKFKVQITDKISSEETGEICFRVFLIKTTLTVTLKQIFFKVNLSSFWWSPASSSRCLAAGDIELILTRGIAKKSANLHLRRWQKASKVSQGIDGKHPPIEV